VGPSFPSFLLLFLLPDCLLPLLLLFPHLPLFREISNTYTHSSCSRFRSSKDGTDGRYAEQPTARLRIPLKLGAGDVGIYFLQSPPDKPLGTVKCWVDDNFDGGKMLEGTADIDDVMASYVFTLFSLPFLF
jgi:hypothetical protein